jgi:hypothetical protein
LFVTPHLIFKRREVDVEEFMWVIQLESKMQYVNDALNGLNHGEDNAHIQGRNSQVNDTTTT